MVTLLFSMLTPSVVHQDACITRRTSNQLDLINYLGNLITTDASVGEEIKSRIAKATATFANLRHQRCRNNFLLSPKGKMYNLITPSHSSWLRDLPRRAEDGRPLKSPKDCLSLMGTSREQWRDARSFIRYRGVFSLRQLFYTTCGGLYTWWVCLIIVCFFELILHAMGKAGKKTRRLGRNSM